MTRKVNAKNGGTLNALEKGETANPNGRPPKLVSHIIAEMKEQGYLPVSASNVREAYEQLLNYPISKLTAIANGKGIFEKQLINGKEEVVFLPEEKEFPIFYRTVAKAMLSGKGFEVIEQMIDRAQGRATQSLKADVSIQEIVWNETKTYEADEKTE